METIPKPLYSRPFPDRKLIEDALDKTRACSLLSCPKCGAVDNFYNTNKRRIFSSSYCEGSQPPETSHRDILGNEHSSLVNCAGINIEHIHVKCRICGCIFLLELPNLKEEKNG